MISTISLPFNVLTEAVMVPMYMRILPLDCYGQFCSAMSIVRSLATILGGLAAGLYLDLMKYLFHSSDYAYRFIPTWIIFWIAIAPFFLWRPYQGWKRRPQVD